MLSPCLILIISPPNYALIAAATVLPFAPVDCFANVGYVATAEDDVRAARTTEDNA